MKKICITMICIILLISLCKNVQAENDLVDVLLLNSYHDGYEWSNDTKQGVKEMLDEGKAEYHFRIEHMDTKNISTDAYMEELVKLYKVKYDKDEFEIIIAADDNALKFLLKYRDELFDKTPVFFCGVNTLATHDLSGADNFYGVVEKHSISQTVEIAMKLNSNLKNVYLVVDDSITGRATKKDAYSDMEYLKDTINFKVVEERSFEEIVEFVKRLDLKNSIVIQSYFVIDKDGSTYPLDYTARRLIESSSVPVFGIFSFGFGEGSVGGKFVEGYTQGQRVARMVNEYVENGSISGDRFIIDESFNRYYFDYNVIKKFNYNTDLLPNESIIINEPISFYKRHEIVINVSLGVLVLLMIYVYILRRQIYVQTSRIVVTQTQLMESEKMASLGRLVAGVAHEVNTPLGIGVSLSSLITKETNKLNKKLEERTLSQKSLKETLAKINHSSELMESTMERASELIRNFKQVAVDQTVDEERDIELGRYIKNIISSLNSELKQKNIKITINSKEEININCYTGALYQIILNLVMNSLKHGFDGRDEGTIQIDIKRNWQDYKHIKGPSISIIYIDDGVGISKTELKKIYDPFFTTKRNKGGSGLGLNIVYNLVNRRLNGTISCQSSVNEYTKFEIVFPNQSDKYV
ncbi:MAG: HAMP domain-containing histidine kinase [Tissierellales bacterium]|jgi:signal transduction histidine kinase|nr:HAMP domain-containing histidine kinase [Tissierellales bacterium]